MQATLTTKGQITLPKALRTALHLSAGDKVIFEMLEDGIFVLKPKTLDVRTLKHCIPYKGTPKTITDMQSAITKNAAQ